MGAGSLWGGDSGLDKGVGRPEPSSGCVLKADPTVGWLWVMTEKRVNRGSDPAPPTSGPWAPLLLFAATGPALGGSCPNSVGSPHAAPHRLSVPSQVPPTEVRVPGSSVQPPPPSVDGGLLQ